MPRPSAAASYDAASPRSGSCSSRRRHSAARVGGRGARVRKISPIGLTSVPHVAIPGTLDIGSWAVSEHVPTTEEQLQAITVGGEPQQLNAPVTLEDYNPQWPRLFEREAARIRAALGDRALA